MAQKVVEVHWLDAVHHSTDYELKDAKRLKPHPTTSVGYLLKRDEKSCIIAQSRDGESFSEVLVIPEGMIKSVKTI